MAFNGGTFLEVKDCIFIKGLPTKANLKISEVRYNMRDVVSIYVWSWY